MSAEEPEGWSRAVGAWRAALVAGGRSQATVRLRTDHVARAGRALGGMPWTVTAGELVEYAASRSWATETRRSVGASLRGFYRWGSATGRCAVDPTLHLPAVSPAPVRARPAPEDVYRQALAVATPRVQLILRLAGEVGMRRGEIAQVHSRDLARDLFGSSLLVHGKGARERLVPLPDGLAAQLRLLGEGWAFPGDDHGHLSPRWVGKLATTVLPGDWTLHTLRHRFATAAYGIERDLLVVQELLGHASPAVTRRYVQVPNDRLRNTVQAVAGR